MADISMEVFDGVFDSQYVFRNLLDAMARPGTAKDISSVSGKLHPTGGIYNTAAAIALTLLDEYAGFAAVYDDMEGVKKYIKWNTRASDSDMGKADYIFVSSSVKDSKIMDIFEKAKKGSLIQPDDSATLIIEVPKIAEGKEQDGLILKLKGPGIEDENIISIEGLSPLWVIKRNEMVSEFPVGVDMVFASTDGHILALPRTTRAELNGEWFLWDM